MKAKLMVNDIEIEVDISEEELKKLQAKENEKKTGYEKVGFGHTYSFVNNYGEVITLNHQGSDDNNRYEEANYYSDYTIAENNARADRLMRQLRRFAVEHRESNIDWKDVTSQKWFICYENEKLSFEFDQTFRTYNITYFDSKESVDLAIKTFRDELIWYFTEYKDSL